MVGAAVGAMVSAPPLESLESFFGDFSFLPDFSDFADLGAFVGDGVATVGASVGGGTVGADVALGAFLSDFEDFSFFGVLAFSFFSNRITGGASSSSMSADVSAMKHSVITTISGLAEIIFLCLRLLRQLKNVITFWNSIRKVEFQSCEGVVVKILERCRTGALYVGCRSNVRIFFITMPYHTLLRCNEREKISFLSTLAVTTVTASKTDNFERLWPSYGDHSPPRSVYGNPNSQRTNHYF